MGESATPEAGVGYKLKESNVNVMIDDSGEKGVQAHPSESESHPAVIVCATELDKQNVNIIDSL